MMVWLRLLAAVLAAGTAAAGLQFLKKPARHRQTALEALARRRNGISCLLLSVLFAAVELYLHL